MTHTFISIFGILLTIFFVVGIHESAHFMMARLMGVKVLRFSIGFGKTLWHRYDKSGTEYVLALVPLGGYVQMLDENEGNVPAPELHRAYNRQAFYKKFLIVIAGPLANIVCALFLYWLVFLIGFSTISPIIGSIHPRSIAAEAGLQSNQEIVAIDGSPTHTWMNIIMRVLAHTGNQDHVKIEVVNRCYNNVPEQACRRVNELHTLDLSNWHMDSLSPDPLTTLGITPFQPDVPLIIGAIHKNSPAAAANFQLGDKIIAINQKPVTTWEEIVKYVVDHPDRLVDFSIKRQDQTLSVSVRLGQQRHGLFLQKSGYLGIGPDFQWPKDLQKEIKYGPVDALTHAWQTICDFVYFNLILFGKLLTGKLSLQSLGGPITIFENAGDALNYGFLPFISFLAFLNISIGMINLLPIPGLDGGHLFIQIIEFIIQKPVPESMRLLFHRLGFIFIFFLLIQAIANDILRIY